MNQKRESRLGKGLGAILGDIEINVPERKPVGYINKEVAGAKPVQDYSDVLRIPSGLIDPNPYQPRMAFDNDSLEELAESIRTFGLIQPISVRRQPDGRYQIISGERRYRACKLAGMDEIPAYIRVTDDQGMLEMAVKAMDLMLLRVGGQLPQTPQTSGQSAARPQGRAPKHRPRQGSSQCR